MKKRIALLVLIVVLVFTFSGCADVTFRFTKLKSGGYRQTLSVTLVPEEIAASSRYTPEEIMEVLTLSLKSNGYEVSENGLTVVAAKNFATLDEAKATLLGMGYKDLKDGNLLLGEEEPQALVVDRGLFFTTTYYTAKSVFYDSGFTYLNLFFAQYSQYGVTEMFTQKNLDVTYEYATIYKSTTLTDGEVVEDGSYFVNIREFDQDDPYITIVSRTPNKAVWYAFIAALSLAFLGILLLIKHNNNKLKDVGGIFDGDN